MATPVPAVDRATAILAFLAQRPQEPQSLSDTARATDIHKATCAAILSALANHDFVTRTADRRYALGPVLVALAHGYAERFPGTQLARHEIHRLSAELKLSASYCVLDGEEMVILDIAGNQKPEHVATRIGKRFPLVPPLGTIFKVWGTPDEIQAWMTRMEKEFEIPVDQQLEVISKIRSQGYSLSGEQDFHVELDAALRRIERSDSDSDVRGVTVAMMLADKIRQMRSINGGDEADQDGPVNYIVAPVFGPYHDVIACMNLFGDPGQIRRRDVPELAKHLLDAAGHVSASIHGSPPPAVGLR
jgi:DNA-binding IclR family transcriptional regulator